MKTKIFLIALSFLTLSCEKNKTSIVKADLTFKSVSFMSAYGASEKQYSDLIEEINKTIENKHEVGKEEEELYRHFDKLKKMNLLKKPYIFLRFNKDSILTVYLSENEFQKIKRVKHLDLFKEGKKAVIELELIKKSNNIYYSNNILSIDVIKGRSHSNGK